MLQRIRSALVVSTACLALTAMGCGASAIQTSAHALEVSARVTAIAGESISLAAETDARSTCAPDLSTACLDGVALEWAPVDHAFEVVRASLGAWYAATLLGEGFTIARALALASAFSQAWANLGAVFPALPPLPELSDLLR